MTHTDLLAKTTLTAAGTQTAVAVGALAGDWTVVVEIFGLDSGEAARIIIEDSVDSTTFGRGGWAVDVTGPIGADSATNGATDAAGASTGYWPNVQRWSIKKKDFPGFLIGTSAAYARVNLAIGSGHITLHAWVEN